MMLRSISKHDILRTSKAAMIQIGRLASVQRLHQRQLPSGFHSAFEQECCVLYTSKGDDVLAGDYDKSIDLYTVAIEQDLTNDIIFAKHCTTVKYHQLQLSLPFHSGFYFSNQCPSCEGLRHIGLYSIAIELDSANDAIFAQALHTNRGKCYRRKHS
jgi:hypothetical protein